MTTLGARISPPTVLAAMPTPAPAVSAMRLSFTGKPGIAQRVLTEFRDPQQTYAVAEAISPEQLLQARSGPDAGNELLLLFIPSSSPNMPELQQNVQSWTARPEPNAAPTIEYIMRSDRILWRPGRAVVIGSPERCEETLAALVAFAFYEGQLRKLEMEIEAGWPQAQADTPLTHQVSPADLRRWGHVNQMTEAVTLRRMRFARLEPHLEKAPTSLPGAAQRIFSELLVQSGVADRLRAVDDRLGVFEDLYELANDRLSEFSYFRREYWLEVWIILILLLEIVAIGWEIWTHYAG